MKTKTTDELLDLLYALVLKEENEELNEEESNLYMEYVDELNEREAEIPFGINI